MNLGIFAFGRAGCKITDHIRKFEEATNNEISEIIFAADTARYQLRRLEYIEERKRVLYGQGRFHGDSARGDQEPAVEATRSIEQTILGFAKGKSKHDIDAFLILGGLGGGTGGGGASVCADVLSDAFPKTPVYGVGILPAQTEPDLHTFNAIRSIQSFSREADNLILFDNDHLGVSPPQYNPNVSDDADPADVFVEINNDIARCLHTVFTADQLDEPNHLTNTTIDTETIERILATGGLSSMCYVSQELPKYAQSGIKGKVYKLVEYFKYKHEQRQKDATQAQEDNSENHNGENTGTQPENNSDELAREFPHVTTLVPKTLDTETAMMNIDPSYTARNIFLLLSPDQYLNKENPIKTTNWATKNTETDYAVAKTYPTDGNKIAVLSICSGIGIPERITEMQRVAEETAQRIMDKQAHRTKPKQVDIFSDDKTSVPPVF